MTQTETYIHGSDPEEQDRLELMNGILNRSCLPLLEVQAGERILEVGAGTGIFAQELARAAGPGGAVVAIERDAGQHAEARRRLDASGVTVELRQGNAYEPPLREDEWASFDLVHARFLLEHLKDPQRAVEHMVRAARPGGRIVLVDDDHSLMRFWPDPGGMVELWDAYAELYHGLGADPHVGRKLVALLVGGGARPVRTHLVDYGACAGEAQFEAVATNLADVVSTGRSELIGTTDWTEERFDEALRKFHTWAGRPDAVIWYGLPCAVAVRP